MSKDDKHNKIISATEIKQRPFTSEDTKHSKKHHKKIKKSDHKHDYVITNIEVASWLRNRGELFENYDNEYVTITYVCSNNMCKKTKTETKRVFIDEWKRKYEKIYNLLQGKFL